MKYFLMCADGRSAKTVKASTEIEAKAKFIKEQHVRQLTDCVEISADDFYTQERVEAKELENLFSELLEVNLNLFDAVRGLNSRYGRRS